jgi:hypothetical protein
MDKPLKRSEERAALIAVLANLTQESHEWSLAWLKRKLTSTIVGALFVIVFLSVIVEPNIYKVLLGVIAFCAGVASGAMAANRLAARQWPAIAKCIDRDKVEARLRELDA